MNTAVKVAVIGGGAYLLWKSGALGSLFSPGTANAAGLTAGARTQTFPDGSTRTYDAAGRIIGTTPATRPATSPASTALQNALIAAGLSAGSAVLIAAIKAALSAKAAAPLTDAQIAALRDRGLTSDTLATLSDEQIAAIRDSGLTTDTVSTLSDADIATLRDAGLTTDTAGSAASVDVPLAPALALTPAQTETLYAIGQQSWEGGGTFPDVTGYDAAGTIFLSSGDQIDAEGTVSAIDAILSVAGIIPVGSVVAWYLKPDGTKVFADGSQLLANGTAVGVDGVVTASAGAIGAPGPTIDALVLGGMGDVPIGDLVFVPATAESLAGQTVSEFAGGGFGAWSTGDLGNLLSAAGPYLAVAGLVLSLALSDPHTYQGQAGNAASIAGAAGSLIGGAIAGAVGGFAGGLVALPIIIGTIFGSMETPRQQDPVQEGVIASGTLGIVLAEIAQGLAEASTVRDYADVLRVTPPAPVPRITTWLGPDQYLDHATNTIITYNQAVGLDPLTGATTAALLALIAQGPAVVTAHLAEAYGLTPLEARYFGPLYGGGVMVDEGGSTTPMQWETMVQDIGILATYEALGVDPADRYTASQESALIGFGAGG